MSKFAWTGGLNESILSFDVVACRGGMNEQPAGLLISRQDGGSMDIDANERFMIVVKLNNEWVASLHPQEVKQDSRG